MSNGHPARRATRITHIRMEAHCPGCSGTFAKLSEFIFARQAAVHAALAALTATAAPSAGWVVHAWTELGAGG